MTTYLGKSCSFGLPRVPFVNCCQFMYLFISLLVLRAGCGIWLYRFLIIAYLSTLVGRVSYLDRVKQGNYHTLVLNPIPNPNNTLPKPYPFMITYPIHHPTLGTQTRRVLPCASINTTLPWTPTYPYPSIVISYSTLPTVGKIPLPNLSIYPTYPIHVTSAYIPVPTSHYLL